MRNLAIIRAIMRIKGLKVYNLPYELNIVGFRYADSNPDKFEDEMHVFFKNGLKEWAHLIYKVNLHSGKVGLMNSEKLNSNIIKNALKYYGFQIFQSEADLEEFAQVCKYHEEKHGNTVLCSLIELKSKSVMSIISCLFKSNF